MTQLNEYGTKTREDLLETDLEKVINVHGLSHNFIQQLRRLCGDAEAIKVDSRLKAFAQVALGREKASDDEVRCLIRKMADKKGVTPAQMDHAVYKWMGWKA